MKSKNTLEEQIAEQDQLLESTFLESAQTTSQFPDSMKTIIHTRTELVNELNHNRKIAELTEYEVNSGNLRINTFLRLEKITNEAVIYHFVKQDPDFKSIASKIAYGSYQSLNMTKGLLKLVLDKFKEKGY